MYVYTKDAVIQIDDLLSRFEELIFVWFWRDFPTTTTNRYVLVFLVAGAVTGLSTVGRLACAGVPPKIQAAIFHKVFKLNKSLKKKGKVTLLGVWDEKTKGHITQMTAAFRAGGISARAVAFAELKGKIKGASVVYTASQPAVVGGLCSKHGVLSITGDASFVKNGKITLAVILKNSKPAIVVSKKKAKLEKQEFASALLKLAKAVD